jgi:hypothetical protein
MVLGSGIQDPGSGIRKKPILGQKGTGSGIRDPDPGSRSATLIFGARTLQKVYCFDLILLVISIQFRQKH